MLDDWKAAGRSGGGTDSARDAVFICVVQDGRGFGGR